MWSQLQHDWPWAHGQIAIFRAIDTPEMILIEYFFIILVIILRIASIDRSSRPVDLRKSVMQVQCCIRAALYYEWSCVC